MLLARQAGEHGHRAHPQAPAASDAEQPAAQDARGEVLVRDRGLAALPACPELVQVGQDHLAEQRVDGHRGEHPVEDRLGARFVEVVQRDGEILAHRRGRERGRRSGLGGGGTHRQGGRLRGGQSRVEVLAHDADAIEVRLRIQAQAAGRAGREQQAVAALPRAQQLGAHARAFAQLADAQDAVVGHTRVIQNLDKILTDPILARLPYSTCTTPVQMMYEEPVAVRFEGHRPLIRRPDAVPQSRRSAMRSFRSILAVSAASAVALAAAGPASAAVQVDRGAPAAEKNIVETAVAAGQFKTLASLLDQAGLVETLSGKSRFTVFAPTDAAFAKVPKATLDALAKDKAKLRAVLLYHVAKGKLTASKVIKRKSIKTLNGDRVSVRVRNGKVYVGGARVTTPDVAGVQRRHPRHQQGADPPLAATCRAPRRPLRAARSTGSHATDSSIPSAEASRRRSGRAARESAARGPPRLGVDSSRSGSGREVHVRAVGRLVGPARGDDLGRACRTSRPSGPWMWWSPNSESFQPPKL